jgi:hypothetical protein
MKALFHLVRIAEANKGFPEIEVLFNYSGQFLQIASEHFHKVIYHQSHFSTLVRFLATGYSKQAWPISDGGGGTVPGAGLD